MEDVLDFLERDGFLLLMFIHLNNNFRLLYSMNYQSPTKSLLQRTLTWINDNAYQRVVNLFGGKANGQVFPQKRLLLFSNLVNNQSQGRKVALSHIRNRNKKGDESQQRSEMAQKLKKISVFWGKREEVDEKPPELVCPICMDILVGGVSTKCGHTFCWQCLDQAVLLNPCCPVCRTQIRGSDFTLSLELTAIIRRYLKRYSCEKEREYQLHYNARAQEFQQWHLKRILNPHKIKSSDLVDVRDTEHIWCSGLVKQIWEIQGKAKAMIHYIGWSSLYDEIIPLDSQRLATYRLYSSRNDIPHYQVLPNQVEGYVLEEPEMREDISSQQEFSEEQGDFQEIDEMVEVQLISDNEEYEQEEVQLSSAKPLCFENPQD